MLNFFDVDNYKEEVNKVSGMKIRVGSDYPTFEEFKFKHRIAKTTWNNWLNSYPEFKEAVEIAKMKQAAILKVNGLNGSYNSQMAKFVGMNDLGMSEKSEVKRIDEDVISEESKKKMIREYLEDLKS
jgi:hypothetical protein